MHIGKHRLSSALIIALTIVFAVIIGGLPTFSHWIQQSNTLTVNDGAVRLGTVYSEQVSSQLIISRVIDNGELPAHQRPDPAHLYAAAVERVFTQHPTNQRSAKAAQNSHAGDGNSGQPCGVMTAFIPAPAGRLNTTSRNISILTALP